jgi:DNA-binding response OmpR family regulator
MKKDGRVLLVEDNASVADAIEAAFPCDRATDGWDAIEKLESGDYAAIVIDTDMARHSGFGVLTYLREEVGEGFDNVIVVTSSDRDALRRRISDNLRVVSKDDAVAEITRVMTSE